MPASAELLVDTSVAVALAVADHEHHEATMEAVGRRRLGLAGHAAFETFSVLTRLPGVSAVGPQTVGALLDRAFPERSWLTPKQHDALLRRLPQLGVTGGMVYDALVGESARVAGRTLLTRDRRAQRTYEAIGVHFEFVE